MAIRIPFIADIAEFLRGTRDIGEGLDDVADALDDLTTAGERVDSEVGADLTSVGKEAEQAADKVERSFKDAFRAVESQGRTSSRRVQRDVDDVGHGAFRDFRDEARQNLAESVSSFRGDAESAVDAVQSTFGGLATALGPAGVVGSVIVAAGIGVLRSVATKAEEAVREVAERGAELAGEFIDADAVAVSIEQITEAIKELATTATTHGKFWWTDASTELIDLRDTSETAGVSFAKMAAGVAAGGVSASLALEDVNARLAEINRLTAAQGSGQSAAILAQAYGAQSAALGRLKTQLEDAALAQDVANESATLALELQHDQADALAALQPALDNSIEAAGASATAAYTHATAAEVQATANLEAAEAVERKNTAIATEVTQNLAAANAEIAYAQAVDDATEAIEKNGTTHDLNTQKGRTNRTMLITMATALTALAEAREKDSGKVEDYNRVIDENRAQFVKAAIAAGYTRTEAKRLADQYGLMPKKVKTEVTDDGTAKKTQGKIDDIHGKDVGVHVKPDLSGVDSAIRSYFNGRSYPFTVYPRPGQPVAS